MQATGPTLVTPETRPLRRDTIEVVDHSWLDPESSLSEGTTRNLFV